MSVLRHWYGRATWKYSRVSFAAEQRDVGLLAVRPSAAVTYQSPLPVFRPVPPSPDVCPAAAEAKLDVKGEGMMG